MGDGRGGEKSRAQLILVGAVALAVALASIALVLNASIYAENLATRANQDEPARISALQQEVATGTAEAMAHHNHDNESHANYTELETRIDASIREWSALQLQDSAREGRFVDADVTSMTRGTRIVQDDGSQFKPEDDGLLDTVVDLVGDSSWAVTSREYRIRDFRMTVERDEIGGGTTVYTEANVSTFIGKLTTSTSLSTDDPTPYTVVYDMNDDGNYEHAISIYRPDNDPDDVNFTYYNTSTGSTTTCTLDEAPATFDVDVSGGSVKGTDGACEGVFDFQSETDDPYQLIFVEGEEIEGDYQLIVDTEKGTFENDYDNGLLSSLTCSLFTCTFGDYYNPHSDDHDSSPSHTSPYVEPAIYDTDVLVTYQSERVESNSTIRVAPDEP
jgi:hypothetical protein